MLFTPKIHRFFFNLALIIIACSLPFSVFTVSVGTFTLVINFLLEGDWKNKLSSLKENKALWISLLIYLPVLYSFFYSSNSAIAIKELRLWVPFLLVPPTVAMSKPLSRDEFKRIMLLFVLAVIVASLISTTFLTTTASSQLIDVRQISMYISHIRFALMVNLAIAILIHFIVFDNQQPKIYSTIMLVLVLWFIVFLFILQSLTGIVMLLLLVLLGFIWFYKSSKSSVARFVLITFGFSLLFIIISAVTHRIDKFYTRNTIDIKKLPALTINGNPYQHDTAKLVYENGNLLYINICTPELKQQWENKSELAFDGMDKKGQQLNQTLIRYLTSLGLTKDSVGISMLSKEDIQLIESGATSVIFKDSKFGLDTRIYQLLWEFDSYSKEGSIGNSSVIQRFVYFKSAWYVIRSNPWFGVGWGDIMESLNRYYEDNNVNLSKELRFKPHNQYLTVWASAGIVGLAIFLVGLVVPYVLRKKYKNFLALYFLMMIMVSMLNEDTFETHIGISLAVLFSSLFIFGFHFSPKANESDSSAS